MDFGISRLWILRPRILRLRIYVYTRFKNRPSAQVNQLHWVHRAIANLNDLATIYCLSGLLGNRSSIPEQLINFSKILIVFENKKQLITCIQTLLRYSEGVVIQHTVCHLSLSNKHLIDKTIHLCHFRNQAVQLELVMGCSHITNISEHFQEYWELSQTKHKSDGAFEKKNT